MAVVGASAALFAVLTLLVGLRWGPMESVDRGLATTLNRLVGGHPPLVRVLTVVTGLGSTGCLVGVVVLATALLVVRRSYRLAGYLLASGVGALVLGSGFKLAVGRHRPVLAEPLATATGYSFPSGHALYSTVVYGALLLVFVPDLPRLARRLVTGVVALLVVAIGFTRLALGVHFLSDVIGAWCLGVAWLGVIGYAFAAAGGAVTTERRPGPVHWTRP